LELLEKGFPIASILAAGSSLAIESILPVHAEDVITLTGRVVDKRQEGDRRVIACQVLVENQDGQTVAEALAEVCLP
jgi:acyl dehydratase